MTYLPLIVLVPALWVPFAYAISAIRTTTEPGQSRIWRLRDRIDVVTGAAESISVLALARAFVPWEDVPPAIWGLALGLAVLGLTFGVRAWPHLPVRRPDSRRPLRWLAGGVDVTVAVALVVLVT